MGATGQHQSLISALDELDTLADGADRDTLAGLRGRLEDGRLRVLVVGEAKRGKEHSGERAAGPGGCHRPWCP